MGNLQDPGQRGLEGPLEHGELPELRPPLWNCPCSSLSFHSHLLISSSSVCLMTASHHHFSIFLQHPHSSTVVSMLHSSHSPGPMSPPSTSTTVLYVPPPHPQLLHQRFTLPPPTSISPPDPASLYVHLLLFLLLHPLSSLLLPTFPFWARGLSSELRLLTGIQAPLEASRTPWRLEQAASSVVGAVGPCHIGYRPERFRLPPVTSAP